MSRTANTPAHPPSAGRGAADPPKTDDGAPTYEIRVAGHLDDHWAATLGNLTLARLDDGTTSLTGPILDQAQLHGVLTGVRDIGVPLLAVRTWTR
jgi:GTPase